MGSFQDEDCIFSHKLLVYYVGEEGYSKGHVLSAINEIESKTRSDITMMAKLAAVEGSSKLTKVNIDTVFTRIVAALK